MSLGSRGIEVHDGFITFPTNAVPKIHLGTWASPLSQIEAGQVVVSAVISITALGGEVFPAYFGVKVAADLTSEAYGLRVRAAILDGITHSNRIQGILAEVEFLGTAISNLHKSGIRIEMYAEAGTTLTGDMYGLWLNNYLLSQPTTYHMIRLTENGSVTVGDAIYVRIGGTADITNLLRIFPAVCTGWSYLIDPPGAARGRIGVDIGGFQRYLQLYQ